MVPSLTKEIDHKRDARHSDKNKLSSNQGHLHAAVASNKEFSKQNEQQGIIGMGCSPIDNPCIVADEEDQNIQQFCVAGMCTTVPCSLDSHECTAAPFNLCYGGDCVNPNDVPEDGINLEVLALEEILENERNNAAARLVNAAPGIFIRNLSIIFE